MSSTLDPHAKIIDRAKLLEVVGRPRDHRLVFTNGVFDVLHRGHVEYLYAARTLGDALVVALNTDASVKRLGKGDDRPVNREHDRAMVIAGLGCVDYVTFFDEETPRDIIRALLPDVLVKGGDYKPEDIVGGAEVEAAGGRVVVIPFVEGHSTTDMLRKIRGTT
jgi:D-glycero-beta-D-manno-heptose 1-phosphate adenylyltransferase